MPEETLVILTAIVVMLTVVALIWILLNMRD